MTQRKKTGVSPKMIKWIWCVALAPFAFVGVLLFSESNMPFTITPQ